VPRLLSTYAEVNTLWGQDNTTNPFFCYSRNTPNIHFLSVYTLSVCTPLALSALSALSALRLLCSVGAISTISTIFVGTLLVQSFTSIRSSQYLFLPLLGVGGLGMRLLFKFCIAFGILPVRNEVKFSACNWLAPGGFAQIIK